MVMMRRRRLHEFRRRSVCVVLCENENDDVYGLSVSAVCCVEVCDWTSSGIDGVNNNKLYNTRYNTCTTKIITKMMSISATRQ